MQLSEEVVVVEGEDVCGVGWKRFMGAQVPTMWKVAVAFPGGSCKWEFERKGIGLLVFSCSWVILPTVVLLV